MFTYDCFYYLLIDLLQIFVSKEFTVLYSLSGFPETKTYREERRPCNLPFRVRKAE